MERDCNPPEADPVMFQLVVSVCEHKYQLT